MKTRIDNMVIAVVMLVACLAFVVAAPARATAQSGTKYRDDETVTKGKTMIFDASKQMMTRAKIMGEAMQTMREGKDPANALQIVTDAEKMMTQGEKMLGQARERAESYKKMREKMKTMMEHYKETIHGSKIMRVGMTRAEAMLTEGPNHLAKDAKKVTAGSETEKGY